MRLFGNKANRWSNKKMDMRVLLFNGFLVLGFFMATVPDVLGGSGSTLVLDSERPTKKCRYSRIVNSMIQAHCTDLGLAQIPVDMKSDIQILDASVNRLRLLTNESLVRYKNLAYIYLGDNFIRNIEGAAFSNLHYLEVLDLSKNGCEDLPKSLFQLPYLRKLYLSDNELRDPVFNIDVKSPLNFLEVSRNRLCKIPEIGPLPSLAHLNLSGNHISTVSSEELAPFCSLKVLDLSSNPIKFDAGTCDCQLFNSWLLVRGIRSKPPSFNCTVDPACSSPPEFTNRTIELYDQCSDILRLRVETEKARNTWILVACCVSAFILCVFIGLFCVHKRNKGRRRKLKEQQRLAVNNANTELLNSNLTPPENT